MYANVVFMLSLQVVFVGRVVDDAESYQHRQQHIHEAVDGIGDVDTAEFLHTEYDERGDGHPQCPGLETVLFVFHGSSPFNISDSGAARQSGGCAAI